MTIHKPVLLQETITGLKLSPGIVAIDGTFGGGGHAREIIKNISPNGTYIGLDADVTAIGREKEEINALAEEKEVKAILVVDNFRNVKECLPAEIVGNVNAVLLDLGFSSDQIENSGRGFSVLRDEPLQMTLADNSEFTVTDIVNSWDESEIEEILKEFGEEQFAPQIAKTICDARKTGPIMRTAQLVELVKKATPEWYHHKKIHPATKTFQALRIAVNDELGALRDFLPQAPVILASGGRLAIISFHSLEDRIVKQQFIAWERSGVAKRINKKAIKPEREEILANRRSRSAKLRVCEFI